MGMGHMPGQMPNQMSPMGMPQMGYGAAGGWPMNPGGMGGPAMRPAGPQAAGSPMNGGPMAGHMVGGPASGPTGGPAMPVAPMGAPGTPVMGPPPGLASGAATGAGKVDYHRFFTELGKAIRQLPPSEVRYAPGRLPMPNSTQTNPTQPISEKPKRSSSKPL